MFLVVLEFGVVVEVVYQLDIFYDDLLVFFGGKIVGVNVGVGKRIG